VRQGEVHWVRFPGAAGRRPALVLTRTSAIGYLRAVTVAEVTTTIRGAPTEVLLTQEDGLPERCVVSLDNLQTVLKANLDGRIAQLGPERLSAARQAIEFALGFDTLG
jgi:mRNA interferase MazF